MANDDIKPWFDQYNPNLKEALKPLGSNSHLRFKAVEKRIASSASVGEGLIKEALRSKDDDDHPVCRANRENGRGFTFASIIMTLNEEPYIQVLAGPPDESDYQRFDFSPGQ
jgi:hypothetical protein